MSSLATFEASLRVPTSRAIARGYRTQHARGRGSVSCPATKKITLLPGDGIGPEITSVAVKVLKVYKTDQCKSRRSTSFEVISLIDLCDKCGIGPILCSLHARFASVGGCEG
jgi:hypothetical protein